MKPGRRSRMDTEPDLATRCAAEYLAGATLQQLSCKYGIGWRMLRDRLVTQGVTIRPHGFQMMPSRDPAPYRGRPSLTADEIERLRRAIGYDESWRYEPA